MAENIPKKIPVFWDAVPHINVQEVPAGTVFIVDRL
jgi:hypothetical protein